MKIKDLKIGDKAVEITVQVKKLGDLKEFERMGTTNRMVSATVEDESGEVEMPLFNEEVDMVKVGDLIKISNGYVGEFNNSKQLRAGRYGKIEIVEPIEEKKDPGKVLKKKKG